MIKMKTIQNRRGELKKRLWPFAVASETKLSGQDELDVGLQGQRGRSHHRRRAAGSIQLGMTVELLEEGYRHRHPDFQAEAAGAFGGRYNDTA